MPNIRVDLDHSRRTLVPALGDALHRALVDGLDMEENDLFQTFTVHDDGELRFSRTYGGGDRAEIIFVQVIASLGYTPEAKQRMSQAIFENLAELGIRRDAVLISVHEIDPANWYLGAEPSSTVGP
ncbi:MAG TPA: tautomerase family protein [Pseudolysinimonas sp.]|nr:tautomerase family protein [Pseudolysinimonas sp.]